MPIELSNTSIEDAEILKAIAATSVRATSAVMPKTASTCLEGHDNLVASRRAFVATLIAEMVVMATKDMFKGGKHLRAIHGATSLMLDIDMDSKVPIYQLTDGCLAAYGLSNKPAKKVALAA